MCGFKSNAQLEKRARRLLRRGAIVAITPLVGAALLSARGSSSSTSSTATKTHVDTARVVASIERTVLEKRHLHTTVVCPVVVPAEPERTFECIATSRGTKPPPAVTKTPFLVTIQTSRGYVTYVGK